MRRLVPHPVMTLTLWLAWLMLTRFSLGMAILGGLVALAAGLAMTRLQMPPVRLRNWRKAVLLLAVVARDVLRSNAAVVRLILAGPRACARRASFLELQLSLRDRHGLAVLAIIITSTPGTTWVEYDPESGRLLLHVLDLADVAQLRALIHNRYEVLLQEIFECPH